MEYSTLLISIDNNIALITINRPDKLNALNTITIKELSAALQLLEKDKKIRAILITGTGRKGIVAGADISEFADYTVIEGTKLAGKGQKSLFDLLANLSTPVIALVNGFALGGGLELANGLSF